MKRRIAVVLALLLVATAAACGGGGGGGGDEDEVMEDEPTATTSGADAVAAEMDKLAEEGEDAFGDYIEALLGGNYTKAMELAKGPASDIAGYFNAVGQITGLGPEFKAPSRQVKLKYFGEGANREGNLIALKAKVDASITGGGADEETSYTDIKLEREGDKLVVVDFTRAGNGPLSEDVLRTSGATGEAGGVTVDMGPGYAMRGKSEGGTLFANMVFSFKNGRDTPVNIKATNNNKLYNAASLDTAAKLYPSATSAGNEAAPGARGLGFVMFNADIEATSGTLTLRFVGEDDMGDEEQIEVKVRLSTL